MKTITIISIIIVYLGWVLVPFFLLNRMADDLKEKHPSLMDKKWKRVLWLLSCLFFIPILIIPCFALDAIKEFLAGDKKE